MKLNDLPKRAIQELEDKLVIYAIKSDPILSEYYGFTEDDIQRIRDVKVYTKDLVKAFGDIDISASDVDITGRDELYRIVSDAIKELIVDLEHTIGDHISDEFYRNQLDDFIEDLTDNLYFSQK